MSTSFTRIDNLGSMIADIPEASIVSRTVYSDDDVRVILFGFAPGQELSEHTAAKPALLHFLSGEAALTLGDEASSAGPGTFVRMEPHLPHSIKAETEVFLLLTLLPSAGS